MSRLLLVAAVLLGCGSPPPVVPDTARSMPEPPPQPDCPGGLLCEAPALLDGWRVPQPCVAVWLGPRVATCWLPGQDWPRLVEFFQSRYPHAVLSGPLLRIAGQAPLPAGVTPPLPGPTPPLLLGHQRPQGVELVLLAGDLVDTPQPATETGPASPASPRRAP